MGLIDLFDDEQRKFLLWYTETPLHRDAVELLKCDDKTVAVRSEGKGAPDYCQTSVYTDWTNEGIKRGYLHANGEGLSFNDNCTNTRNLLAFLVYENIRTGAPYEDLIQGARDYHHASEWAHSYDVYEELRELSDFSEEADADLLHNIRQSREPLVMDCFNRGVEIIRREHPRATVKFDKSTAVANLIHKEFNTLFTASGNADYFTTIRKYCKYSYDEKYGYIQECDSPDADRFHGNRYLAMLLFNITMQLVKQNKGVKISELKNTIFRIDRRSFNHAINRQHGKDQTDLLDELSELESCVIVEFSSEVHGILTVLSSNDDYIDVQCPGLIRQYGDIVEYNQYAVQYDGETDNCFIKDPCTYRFSIESVKAKSAPTMELLTVLDGHLTYKGNQGYKKRGKGVKHGSSDARATKPYHKSYKGILEECPELRTAYNEAGKLHAAQVFRRALIGSIKKADIEKDQTELETRIRSGRAHYAGTACRDFVRDPDKVYITSDNADRYTIGKYIKKYTCLFECYQDLTIVLDRPVIGLDTIDGNIRIYDHGVNDAYKETETIFHAPEVSKIFTCSQFNGTV